MPEAIFFRSFIFPVRSLEEQRFLKEIRYVHPRERKKYALAMNLFGTRERTNLALGVDRPAEIGEMMVGLMKPDIGSLLRKPWTGLGLLRPPANQRLAI